MRVAPKQKIGLVVLSLALIMASLSVSYADEDGGFTYDVVDGHAVVTGYTRDDEIVIIPATLGGYTVTKIADFAFYGMEALDYVVCETGLTTIGQYAFAECTGLQWIRFSSTVTTIGDYAFAWCAAMTSFQIPAALSSLGDYALYRCPSLQSIEVTAGNAHFATLGGALYSKSSDRLYCCLQSVTGTFLVPDTVVTIAPGAFDRCRGLTGVTFLGARTLRTIGDFAFSGCAYLTQIDLPDSVTTLGRGAFMDCFSLRSIRLSGSVSVLPEHLLSGCVSLTQLTLPASVSAIGSCALDCFSYGSMAEIMDPDLPYIDTLETFTTSLVRIDVAPGNAHYSSRDGVLFDQSGQTLVFYPYGRTNATYCVPERVQVIDERAFFLQWYLEEVFIPSTLMTLSPYAFMNCPNLKVVTFEGDPLEVESGAFFECPLLALCAVPGTDIAEFARWESIPVIPLQTGYRSAGQLDLQLGECVSLDATGTDGETLMGQSLAPSVASVDRQERITAVGTGTALIRFVNAQGVVRARCVVRVNALRSPVALPDGCESIGPYAFEGCLGLEAFCPPNATPVSIAEKAFLNCASLCRFEWTDTLFEVANDAFEGCSSLVLYVHTESGAEYARTHSIPYARMV